MALTKQPISLNFAQGLDTKTDDKQVQAGKFLTLTNSVFDKAGRLTKRNGFARVTSLYDSLQTTLTTLNDNLIATGSSLYAYSQDTDTWLNQGNVQPVDLATLPLVRVSTSQTSPDAAVASSGLTCLVYVDNAVSYYQISDSSTGQQIVARTSLGSTATNPRVFILGQYFVITFTQTVAATTHMRYIAIPVAAPSSPLAVDDIDTVVDSLTTGYDGYVANNNLYVAFSGSATTIRIRYLSSTLGLSPATTITSHTATLMSVTADTTGPTPIVWLSYWDSSSTNGFVAAFSHTLAPVLASTQIITTTSINEITAVSYSNTLLVFYENANVYGGTIGSVKTDYITRVVIDQTGVILNPATVILRSVGLASKAFLDVTTEASTAYMLVAYGETNQPTYFLMDEYGKVYMRLAYSNGGGYATTQVLPTVTLVDDTYFVPYRANDFLAPVNKSTNLATGTPVNAIYTQTGINLAKIAINTSGQYSSEIAGALHLTGGQLWEYDGVRPVEHGFHVWPENVASSTATGSGSIAAGTYYYAFCYEWTDNQGLLHRSSPSIPIKQVTTTASSTNTLLVPTLRITDKLSPNPARIVGYRWSTAQQVYYQFTSLTSPTANSTATDYVTITDTQSDAQILGTTVLYTTGGVIENIAAPASTASALFKNRLFLIDAEDRNLLWYSKQVIQNVPVEMSDLLTIYIAPTTGAQGSTGPMTALSALDDKLIIFKKDAIYYLTGIGPDNTGAQNDFSDPTYITASVGCDNPNSIVLTPMGIMFQSDKGIWLLTRDLNTQYIGAPVEDYNDQTVLSAQAIPATNQVRFVLDNRVTLMYDYYFNQWGTFSNVLAISSTLWQGLDTYLNSSGQVYQETIGQYLDGSNPVLMSFTSAWINMGVLQGYERFYQAYLLGTYFTPFKLNVQFAYDYGQPSQSELVTPDNYTPAWGGEAAWGSGGPWGGIGNVFEARLFPQTQKCSAFQITVNEIFDASLGVAAGQGLTLSGMNLIIGSKKGYRTQSAKRSFG